MELGLKAMRAGFYPGTFGGNSPPPKLRKFLPPPMSEVRIMASCSDCSDHSLSHATVTLVRPG